MVFKMEEVLSPFNRGNLKKGDLIFASDNLETLRKEVLAGSTSDVYKFEEYSTNIDSPFKSGVYGVTTYRYAYPVKNEEMTFKPNSWMKFI